MARLTETGEDLKEAGDEGSLLGVFAEFLRLRDERNREDDSDSSIEPLPIYRFPANPDSGIARGFAEVNRPGSMPLALMEVINDPMILVTEEMLPIINTPDLVVTREGQPAKKLSGRDVIRSSGQFSRANILPDLPKKKRKVSKYQKEFGKQLKKLKLKHPRTKISQLMKRAHRATRKVMK